MLPTLSLTPTDATALSGETGESLSPAGGSTQPEGSFAALLRPPVMVTSMAGGGDVLPLDGNPLPDSGDPAEVNAANRLAALLQRQGDAPFSDQQNDRAALALEELRPMAEERALRLAEEEGAPVVSPLLALTGNTGRPLAGSLPGGMSQFKAGEDTADGVLEGLAESVHSGIENARRAKSPASELAARAPFTLLTAEVPAARASVIESLPVIADSAQNALNTSALSSSSAPTTAVPLAAQPLFGATPTAASPLLETSISLPVQDSAWGETLNERVVFMSGQKIQNAEIRLTPAELGPIRVSVALEDGATNITFNAQHATTREAIESALPRLREMLAEQGLSLGNTSVSDQSADQGNQGGSAEELANESSAINPELPGGDSGQAGETSHIRSARGLVDTFA